MALDPKRQQTEHRGQTQIKKKKKKKKKTLLSPNTPYATVVVCRRSDYSLKYLYTFHCVLSYIFNSTYAPLCLSACLPFLGFLSPSLPVFCLHVLRLLSVYLSLCFSLSSHVLLDGMVRKPLLMKLLTEKIKSL